VNFTFVLEPDHRGGGIEAELGTWRRRGRGRQLQVGRDLGTSWYRLHVRGRRDRRRRKRRHVQPDPLLTAETDLQALARGYRVAPAPEGTQQSSHQGRTARLWHGGFVACWCSAVTQVLLALPRKLGAGEAR
jgi:hypothetical protein